MSGQEIRKLFIFLALLIPNLIFSQTQNGKILSSKTNIGIPFVNVGIIGKNIGTVSDEFGVFNIILDKKYFNDSIRFSAIGYFSKTFIVSEFIDNSTKIVYLNPKIYEIGEAKVTIKKRKLIRLGIPIPTSNLCSGFFYNNLGEEMGINVDIKKPVRLTDINMNIAICTYDTVSYRLNIYKLDTNNVFKNILLKPIYITFSNENIADALTFDLSDYSIIIHGNTLITIELYKNLGEGKLLFRSKSNFSSTYFRNTSEGGWHKSPNIIGVYLHGQQIKL